MPRQPTSSPPDATADSRLALRRRARCCCAGAGAVRGRAGRGRRGRGQGRHAGRGGAAARHRRRAGRAQGAPRSRRGRPDRLVLGADQVLVCEGRLFDKPARPRRGARAARARCAAARHELLSAAVVFEDGRAGLAARRPGAADHAAVQRRLPRRLSRRAGRRRCSTTVGAYRLEDGGAQLFSRVEGDLFTILGLPLLELLGFLRTRGVVPRMTARAAASPA